MKKQTFILFIILSVLCVNTQAAKIRALFLGNSYTENNNLPGLVAQFALAAGDTLEYKSNTPGGHTLQNHFANATSLSLIEEGDWDFVILQEQSQLPAFPDGQVAVQMFPYAEMLSDHIKLHNADATVLFYMTWGRKNGDQQNCDLFPPLCTYEGMDSMLQLRYTMMAEYNEAAIAPVAKVWRKLRNDHPGIELYSSDESHPSNNGSFAAACTFYAVMFRKDPTQSNYNFTVSPDVADIIRNVTKEVVFDDLSFWYRFVGGSGIGVPTIHSEILLYPNPASDRLTICVSQPVTHLVIHDITGKEHLTQNITAHNTDFSLNINHLPAGVYLISLFDGRKKLRTETVVIDNH